MTHEAPLAARKRSRLGFTVRVLAFAILGLFAADRILRWVLVSGSAPQTGDTRAADDGFPKEPWVSPFLKETDASAVVEWSSYVYWRRRPFAGQFINVDAEGRRRTWNPRRTGSAQAPVVLFFGGSAAWGSGARDEMTIPSHLSRLLHAHGVEAQMRNHGETGYVSTQELASLVLRLRAGEQPALVILYDGVNDALSALQSGRAGLPQNEIHRIKDFNLSGNGRRLLSALVAQTWNRSGFGTLAGRLGTLPPEDKSRDDPRLAASVLEMYKANARLVEALAKSYGFQALFVWQPNIFHKRLATAYEAHRRLEARAFEPLFLALAKRVREEPSILDLSALFESTEAQRFLDFCHLTEAGNLAVAERLLEPVRAALASAATPRGPA